MGAKPFTMKGRLPTEKHRCLFYCDSVRIPVVLTITRMVGRLFNDELVEERLVALLRPDFEASYLDPDKNAFCCVK